VTVKLECKGLIIRPCKDSNIERKSMAENNTDLKVEIKGLKKDIEQANNLNSRLDTAIEKLTDVSTSIKSMLAVHEEKIQRQEQIDEIIFEKLKERAGEIDTVHRELSKEIQQVEKKLLLEIRQMKLDLGARVSIIEKYRWLIMGGALVIGWILSTNFKTIIEMMS
jgi:predicted RNase H-like nuclease (RuvC/YqgF family)